MKIILLTTLGFALVLLDLLLIPGAIFVILGSVIILYSVYLNYQAHGIWLALIHFAFCLALIPKLITLSMGRLALKNEMNKDDGYMGVDDHSGYVGMRGIAHSDLRPSGTVAVMVGDEEEHLDCISEGGLIEKGDEVEIVEDRGTSLVVIRARPSTAGKESAETLPGA